jgi:hypothetical protein
MPLKEQICQSSFLKKSLDEMPAWLARQQALLLCTCSPSPQSSPYQGEEGITLEQRKATRDVFSLKAKIVDFI